MSKEQCWVAVDRDGTEKISNSEFIRRKGIRSAWWGFTNVFYSKNKFHKWGNCVSTDETDAIPFTGVIMPKGTIEKLIGKPLTWVDDPFEIIIEQQERRAKGARQN